MTNYGFARKKASTWIATLVMVAGILAMFGGQAHAVSGYLASFNSQYGTSGTALNTCTLCHTSPSGGSRNPYGSAYGNAGHSFTSIANLDSDGDGFTNVAEITARTFPGDAASKPATPPPPPPPTDTTPPTVNSTSPVNGATAVQVGANVTVTFSEAMAGASLTTATFTLVDGSGNPVAGTVTPAGATATFAPTANLANGTTYTATVTTGAEDLAGNGLAQSRVWSFTTVAVASDTDGDGIPDNLDAFPNDNRKGTVPYPTGGQETIIDTSSTPGARLMGMAAMADTDASLNQTGKPAGFVFGNGVIAFQVAGLAPGGTANVVLTFPASIPANAKVFKIDSGGFHEFPGAVISGLTVTLTLTDGGAGDSDGVANGVIVDPVGLATPVAAAPVATAPDSSGGGCAVAGTGGGPLDAVGGFGFLALIALGLLVRKAVPGKR